MSIEVVPTYGGPLMLHVNYMRKFLGARRVLLEQHLPHWRSGGIGGMVIHVQSVDEAAMVLAEVEESQGRLEVVSSPEGLKGAVVEGDRTAVMLCASFDDVGLNPSLLNLYKNLGAVSFALSLNSRNMLVDGCAERTKAGLSELGVAIVRRLTDYGMLIDVSHTSDAGFWDVLDKVEGGVFASHSNARALCDNPRNLTNEMIRALADHDGMVGISTYPTLLSESSDVTVDDAVRHIEHLISLVGVDRVGVSADFIDYALQFVMPKIKATDFNGKLYGARHPTVMGLDTVEDFPQLAVKLEERGFSAEDVRKIMGGNFLRFWSRTRAKQRVIA